MSKTKDGSQDIRDKVKKHVVEDDVPIAPVELKPITKQIAMHYRGDNVSPVMVSVS